MSRVSEQLKYVVSKPEPVPMPLEALKQQVKNGDYQYLLAYADDGVIWGYVKDGKLFCSGEKDSFPDTSPALREKTLWEARLFGEKGEWLLWRSEDQWHARTLTETKSKDNDAFTENYILWGTDDAGDPQGGFYPVREADMGILHTPPIPMKSRHALRLKIRHYLDYDDEACAAYVKLSRLVTLENGD